MAERIARARVAFQKELVAAVDRLVGRRKRSAFVVDAVQEKLEREQLGRALAETRGILDKDSHPEWSTPEKTSAWVRELRAIAHQHRATLITRDTSDFPMPELNLRPLPRRERNSG